MLKKLNGAVGVDTNRSTPEERGLPPPPKNPHSVFDNNDDDGGGGDGDSDTDVALRDGERAPQRGAREASHALERHCTSEARVELDL